MALSTKAIKQKIKSVGNIKKITQTMEMVSVSKMRKAVGKAKDSRSYSMLALELLVNISKSREIKHVAMEQGKGDKELMVIVAGNKGLCGGYNSNIQRAIVKYLETSNINPQNVNTLIVGKYADKISKKMGFTEFASFPNFSESSEIKQTRELSSLLYKEYSKGEYKSAKIVYTEFVKSTTYKPVIKELFPISLESFKNMLDTPNEKEDSLVKERDFENYMFEPSVVEIANSVLPGLVDSVVYQTLLESYASEHSARMFAMKNAGDNAESMLDDLVLSYNHARQSGITRELSEIVAGAEALSG